MEPLIRASLPARPDSATTDPAAPIGRESGWVQRAVTSRPFMVGVVMVGIPLVAAVAAPLVARESPIQLGLHQPFSPPSWQQLMGTDELGRNVFSRVVYGARVTLGVTAIAVAVGLAVGTLIGLIGGYLGGIVDSVLMRLMDALLAFPAILLAIAIVSSLGPGIAQATTAIGIVSIPGFARVARAQTLKVKQEQYVEAGRALGTGPAGIIVRHILPNAMAPIIALTATHCASTILTVASLAFVGLGAQPPTPDWGGMLQTGYPYLARAWWLSVFPGAAIALLSLGFIFLGDGLQDTLDPRRSH